MISPHQRGHLHSIYRHLHTRHNALAYQHRSPERPAHGFTTGDSRSTRHIITTSSPYRLALFPPILGRATHAPLTTHLSFFFSTITFWEITGILSMRPNDGMKGARRHKHFTKPHNLSTRIIFRRRG